MTFSTEGGGAELVDEEGYLLSVVSDRPSEVYATPGPPDARSSCCQPATKPSHSARPGRAAVCAFCLAFVALAGFSPALAQHVSSTIWLPDSLAGVVEPTCAVYNSREEKL
jgi:hypothetical protein